MEIENVKIERTYYIADDGKRFAVKTTALPMREERC